MIGNESTRDLFPKKPCPLPRSAILHLWTAAAWNDENALSWIEALPTQVTMRPFHQLHNRYPMTFLAKARRRIQAISPYLSLLVLLIPLLLVEPLKFAALFVAGKGHWITGTGILVAAYIVSLFFVERLFRVVKPKLLLLPWFAKLWHWYETARNKTIAVVTGQPR